MPNVVETERLCLVLRGVEVVRDVQISLPEGEIVGLIGPGGAGKTSLLNLLAGTVRPTSGSGKVLGSPLGEKSTRRKIGVVPQVWHFSRFASVEAVLKNHGRRSGMRQEEIANRIPELLSLVNLKIPLRTKVNALSLASQQKLCLAQALLPAPDLLLLDNPTSALDPHDRKTISTLLESLRSQGKTALIVSSHIVELERLCDRVLLLHQGQIVAQIGLNELSGEMTVVDVEVRDMTDSAMQAMRQVVAKVKLSRLPVTQFTVFLSTERDIPVLAGALQQNGAKLIALIPRHPSLEERYFQHIPSQS